jgi:glucose/arabinose dehydrogenase
MRGSVRRRGAALAGALLLASVLVAPAAAAPGAAPAATSGPATRGTQVACPPGEAPPTAFADPLGVFASEVRCLVGHDIARGRTAATYDVASAVTRAQLATLTHATLDAAAAAPRWDGVDRFRDVASRGTHVDTIGALAGPRASADGPILRGFDDRTFRPSAPITRAQAASTIDRALRAALPRLQVPDDPACRFRDEDRIAAVHREATRRLCVLGIAQGRSDGRFEPGGSVTRGQATAFLARGLDLLAEEGRVRSPFPIAVEVLADGLEAPWDVVRTGAGRWFLTERDRGRVLELVDGRLVTRRTFTVDTRNSNGLLGLTAGPDGLLYAYYTSSTDNRIVRFDPDGGPVEPVLLGIPKGPQHGGGRMIVGADGMLYIGTGDATANGPTGADARRRAQDTDDLAGKVLRIHLDGRVPADNPHGNEVWAHGFRNVQGLAFDGAGRLWATDFGPELDDEVNLVVRGGDYGWPTTTGTRSVNGSRPAAFVRQPPEASWSGMTVARSDLPFARRGELLVGALRGQRIWRLTTDGATVTRGTSLLPGHLGRVRTVVDVGDGGLYVITDNATRGLGPFRGDALLRLTPR